jgi:hypothetical protein
MSRDSSVGVATGYWVDGRSSGGRSLAGAGGFLFTAVSRSVLGPTQRPIQWVPGTLSLGVKRPGHEADTPPSNVEVKNVSSYTSTPPYVFMAWYLVKPRNNFPLPLQYNLNALPPYLNLHKASLLNNQNSLLQNYSFPVIASCFYSHYKVK